MILALAMGCGPAPSTTPAPPAFPWAVTPETDLEPYEEVRWETESWSPTEDLDQVGLYLQKALLHRKGAPVETLAHFDAMRTQIPPLAEGLELVFIGDIMYVDQRDWSTYTADANPLLATADIRIGNLETPTSDAHPTTPRALGTYAFNAPSAMLDGLPVDVLQLNNNHSLDAGDDGLQNTLDALSERGIRQVGVDAQTVLDVDGTTVALLAYTWGMNDGRTTELFDLNTVRFGQIDATPLDHIRAQIEAHPADHVVVLAHWGFEYEYYPDAHFMRLARQIIALGADVVVGHGPHTAQPAEICHVNRPEHTAGIGTCSVSSDTGEARTAAVLYSLGNFGTDQPTLPLQSGLVARVTLGEAGVTGLGWEPVLSTTNRGTPVVVPLAHADPTPERTEEELRLETHLGAGWRTGTAR